MNLLIGISLGDITGIGPEVTLKALATEIQSDETRFLLIGDLQHIRALNRQLGLNLPLQSYRGKEDFGRIFVCNPLTGSLTSGLPPGAPVAARAAVAWVRDGA